MRGKSVRAPVSPGVRLLKYGYGLSAMFGKKKLNLQNMSSEQMEAFLSRSIKRILLKNILWILFVIGMLFWMPAVGVILLIVTAIKYLYDYYDVDSQNHHLGFLEMIRIKRDKERTQK